MAKLSKPLKMQNQQIVSLLRPTLSTLDHHAWFDHFGALDVGALFICSANTVSICPHLHLFALAFSRNFINLPFKFAQNSRSFCAALIRCPTQCVTNQPVPILAPFASRPAIGGALLIPGKITECSLFDPSNRRFACKCRPCVCLWGSLKTVRLSSSVRRSRAS